jgi:hypothetical protein
MELFPDDMNPPPASPVLHTCPVCGRSPLGRVADCEIVHWLCASCGHCWQESHGGLRRVDPLTCPGCATKPRDECLVIFGGEFPRFSG